ncbi:MAG: hypothetical protein KF729_35605 [Sandaracinaceae bacterium]|nr:hypothetical protein [Sandaracinaceae bacterium]
MSDALAAAERALAAGDLETARARLLAAPFPVEPQEALRLLLALVEAGAVTDARRLAERCAAILDVPSRPGLAELLDDAAPPPPTELDEADADLDAAELVRANGPADADLVAAFTRWFGGRPDLYARQWFDARRRRAGYRPVREPLTADAVRAHLEGRHTLGQYLLWPDATVSFAVLDLDLDASALAELEAARGPGSATRHAGLAAYAARVLQRAAALRVPLTVTDSGRRGVHLWAFFEPRRPARAARALFRRLLDAAGPPPPDVSVELFPKQDAHGSRGLSSLVKLPLGLHQVSMRRCPILDERLAPIDDARAALGAVRAIEPRLLDDVVGRRLAVLPVPDRAEAAPALPRAPSPRSLAQVLRQLPDGRPARDAALRMIDGCAVLAALVDRAYRERALTADEARAIIYTLGLAGAHPALAIEVLRAAEAPMKELHRAQKGMPSPTGCRRLRELGVADCRGCAGLERAEPYATPALFAVGAVPLAPPRHAPFAAWLEPAGELAADAYEDLASRLEHLDERLRRLEPALSPSPAEPSSS